MKKMAYLGPTHTFSDVCYQKHFSSQYDAVHARSIDEVFACLSNETDILVPIENSTDGFVQKTLDYLIQSNAYIVETMYVPVAFAFIGDLAHAKKLFVQFKTLGQCQQFISKHPHLEVILTASNQASYDLKKTPEDAAIIPLHMVSDEPHIPHIEDYIHNQTRFIHVSQNPSSNGDRASIIITPKIDRPGLLYDILGLFIKHQMNLVAIISRPTKTVIGTYHFYIETQLSTTQSNDLTELIDTMRQTFDVKYLGSYKKK